MAYRPANCRHHRAAFALAPRHICRSGRALSQHWVGRASQHQNGQSARVRDRERDASNVQITRHRPGVLRHLRPGVRGYPRTVGRAFSLRSRRSSQRTPRSRHSDEFSAPTAQEETNSNGTCSVNAGSGRSTLCSRLHGVPRSWRSLALACRSTTEMRMVHAPGPCSS